MSEAYHSGGVSDYQFSACGLAAQSCSRDVSELWCCPVARAGVIGSAGVGACKRATFIIVEFPQYIIMCCVLYLSVVKGMERRPMLAKRRNSLPSWWTFSHRN